MNIEIDKADKSPAYKQLARQLEAQILSGALKPGEKLPTEREMEKATGLSRGTIKAAYYELQQNKKITAIQGSGTFVSRYDPMESRLIARDAIQNLLDRMQAIGITPLEVSSIFSHVMEQYLYQWQKVRVVWVDCCDEVLSAVRYQLRNSKEIMLKTVLIPEFHEKYEELAKESDLIVTTTWHFNEISFALPAYVEIIERVMMDLSINSIIEMAKIPAGSNIVLWSGSQAFMRIMIYSLNDFENLNRAGSFVGMESLGEMRQCLQNADVMLTGCFCPGENYTELSEIITEFQNKGGKVIPFDYHVNKGSMLHFQERVSEIYQQKNKAQEML